MESRIRQILDLYPLRISITDYCNLDCFFCSNEGMERERRNKKHMDVNDFDFLVKVLAENGLKHVSLTGGEPTLHPELEGIVETLKKHKIEKTFFHTNGIALSDRLMELGIKDFTKIAISIHTLNYTNWSRITLGTLSQYQLLRRNLERIGSRNLGRKIEIKHVPIKGYNDGDKDIRDTLDLCNQYGYKFKFLNFEAVEEGHIALIIPYAQFTQQLERLGCVDITEIKPFRGQMEYLPAKWYRYGKTIGVAIEIGCGEKDVCKSCYISNEIFLTPSFEIKPCHADDYIISLSDAIKMRRSEDILESIVKSREFLSMMPGQGVRNWRR